MEKGYLLGCDIGTYSSKGVLVAPNGKVLFQSSIAHKVSIPKPGWMEHDPDDVWLHDFLFIVKDLLSKSGVDPKEIIGVGISSICTALTLLDEDRKPLRPSILYGVDTRATEEVAEIIRDLGTFVSNQNIPPKLRWVQKNEPEVWAKTKYFFSGHHYLIMKMTGEITQNVLDTSSFFPLFDFNTDNWNQNYFDYFQINPDILPRLVWPTEIAGRVNKEGALLSGLAEGTPIVGGCNDSSSESVSVGVTDPGDMMQMYGSSNIFYMIFDKEFKGKNLPSVRLMYPDQFGFGGGLGTVGSLTTWFRDNLAYQELKAEQEGGENAFASLANLSHQSCVGSNGLIALPYFSGERNPIFDGYARGMLFGLNLTHTRADIYRALLESVGYGIRHNMEIFWNENQYPQHIVAIGGGVHNLPWMQIVCDICNFSQEIPEIKIGACYGDAFLAAKGIGLYENGSDVKQWVKIEKILDPDPEAHEQYNELYQIYRDLYPANKDIMHQISAIQNRE
jgi:xylulokinase